MNTTITKKQLNFIYAIVLASSFYFSILPYLIKNLGINVNSGFYQLTHYSSEVFNIVLILNTLYFLILSFAFYFGVLKYKTYIHYNLANRLGNIFIIAIIIVAIIFSLENFSLSRNEIKDESSLGIEILYITALTLISYITLTSQKKLVLIFNILLVLYFSLVLFEREVILYGVIPFMLRKGVSLKSSLKFLLIFSFLIALVLNYKVILNVIKTGDPVHYSSQNDKSILYSLGIDSIHKMSLEISYFEGDAPNYNHFTFFVPYQVLRIFDSTRTTNGRLATEYYTNNTTGTGFSLILEGILNFSYAAIFILPIVLVTLYQLFFKYTGLIALTPFIVFIVKVNRAEIWPLLLSTLILPLLFIYILSHIEKILKYITRI